MLIGVRGLLLMGASGGYMLIGMRGIWVSAASCPQNVPRYGDVFLHWASARQDCCTQA